MVALLKQLCYRHFEEQIPITLEGCAPETTERIGAFAARIRELGGEVLRDLGPNIAAKLLQYSYFPSHIFRYMSNTTVLDLKHSSLDDMTFEHLLILLRMMFAEVSPADSRLTELTLQRDLPFNLRQMMCILRLCPRLEQLSISSPIRGSEQDLVRFSVRHPSLRLFFKIESRYDKELSEETSSSQLLKQFERLKNIKSTHHIVWLIDSDLFNLPSAVDDISTILQDFTSIHKLVFMGFASPTVLTKIHEIFQRHRNCTFKFSLYEQSSLEDLNLPNATRGTIRNNIAIRMFCAPAKTAGICELMPSMTDVDLPVYRGDLIITETNSLSRLNAPKAKVHNYNLLSPQTTVNISWIWNTPIIKILMRALITLEIIMIAAAALNHLNQSSEETQQ